MLQRSTTAKVINQMLVSISKSMKGITSTKPGMVWLNEVKPGWRM